MRCAVAVAAAKSGGAEKGAETGGIGAWGKLNHLR